MSTCTCQHAALCHAYATAARDNSGRCLALGCGCGGWSESAQKAQEMGGKSAPTWENGTSPTVGVSAPRPGSDHLPEQAERG